MDFKSYNVKLKKLCEKHGVSNLFVFGSVLTENFSKKSDLDFLVEFSKNLTPTEYAESYFHLHEELEELFARPIDLITKSTLTNPYLIESLNQTKSLIYAA